MPVPPYAQLLISRNGGGPQTGAIVCSPGDTIQFTAGSVVGWQSAPRWEFYGYPPGWSTPAGWTLDSNGTIFSTANPPPLITLPSVGGAWGKWAPRLIVNHAQVDPETGAGDPNPQLVDSSTVFEILSPGLGLHDMADGESDQWAADWSVHHRANLRALDESAGPGALSGAGFGFYVDPVTGQWRTRDSTGVVTTLTYGSKVTTSGPNGDLT